MRQLSRTLSVSKQFNENIPDSAQFRRTLFLDSKRNREFLKMMGGQDPRYYEDPNEWQPVIVRETSKRHTWEIVEPHPLLLEGLRTGTGRVVTLRNFNMINTVPASAFVVQPPLDEVTIEHWGHNARVRAPGGVTFGAILKATEEIRNSVEDNLARSPRFAAYQYGHVDNLTLSMNIGVAVFNDAPSVMVARKALEKAKQFAVLDELEEKLT